MYLFHGERMDNFTPIVGQLGCFIRTDDRDQSRSWDFPGIRSEDSIYFFPYLKFSGSETDCYECRCKVCIASAYLAEE